MVNKSGSLKWLWAALMIIGIIILGVPLLFMFGLRGFMGGSLGAWGFIGLIPLSIVALLVWGLVSLFSKKNEDNKSNKRVYKSEKTNSPMKIQYLFYIVGVVFIFVATWYFAREYIKSFPSIIKLILLIVSIVITYVIAEFFRGANK